MDHRRFCVRPDCCAVAEVALTYDYAQSTVWLDDLSAAVGVGAWGMCSAHADGLTVPSGWSRVDRRSGSEPAEEDPEEATPPLSFLPPLAV